jgi:hypothetical protein
MISLLLHMLNDDSVKAAGFTFILSVALVFSVIYYWRAPR